MKTTWKRRPITSNLVGLNPEVWVAGPSLRAMVYEGAWQNYGFVPNADMLRGWSQTGKYHISHRFFMRGTWIKGTGRVVPVGGRGCGWSHRGQRSWEGSNSLGSKWQSVLTTTSPARSAIFKERHTISLALWTVRTLVVMDGITYASLCPRKALPEHHCSGLCERKVTQF